MKHHEAVALLRGAAEGRSGAWADLGAGNGTFTRALAELLTPGSRIYALDRDPKAVAALERMVFPGPTSVRAVRADLAEPLVLPGLGDECLDGILLANALHFVPDAEQVLARLATQVRRGGRVVVVEYERRGPSRWVPFPIPPQRLNALTVSAGLSEPMITATRPSDYGGSLYVAVAER